MTLPRESPARNPALLQKLQSIDKLSRLQVPEFPAFAQCQKRSQQRDKKKQNGFSTSCKGINQSAVSYSGS